MLLLTKVSRFEGFVPTAIESISQCKEYEFKGTTLGSMRQNCMEFSAENTFRFWKNINNFIYIKYIHDFADLYNEVDVENNFYDTQEELAKELPKKYSDEYVFIVDIIRDYNLQKPFLVRVLPASKMTKSPNITKQLRILTIQALSDETTG